MMVVWWLLLLLAAARGCPSPASLLPCRCGEGGALECAGALDEEELASVLRAATKPPGVQKLKLKGAAVRFFPEGAFHGTNLQVIELVNSSVLSLSENEKAFEGLEESLTTLSVTNNPYVNNWDWSQLKDLQKLQVLEIIESELLEITGDFMWISKLPLREISFRSNNLQSLPYQAFATFKDIAKISLESNSLTSLMRSTLPVPAKKLLSLNLSNNLIRNLSSNAFSDMPALKHLYLGGNLLQTLPVQVFQPVWKHLTMVSFPDISCDCGVEWLPTSKAKNKLLLIFGHCTSPESLVGTRIMELKTVDFQC